MKIPVLPSSCATLTVSDVVVTSKMREVLKSAANCSDIREYVKKDRVVMESSQCCPVESNGSSVS
eukprot:10314938-Ditylum_brightwellii.AAC.1